MFKIMKHVFINVFKHIARNFPLQSTCYNFLYTINNLNSYLKMYISKVYVLNCIYTSTSSFGLQVLTLRACQFVYCSAPEGLGPHCLKVTSTVKT